MSPLATDGVVSVAVLTENAKETGIIACIKKPTKAAKMHVSQRIPRGAKNNPKLKVKHSPIDTSKSPSTYLYVLSMNQPIR